MGGASVRISNQSGAYASVEDIVIPTKITVDGNTYRVTAIEDYGMTGLGNPEGYSHWNDWLDEKEHDTNKYAAYRREHANFMLKTITFEQPSNIKTIGKGAFQGCVNLSKIVVPNSVETLGTEVFTECYSLRNVEFQTDANDRVKIKVLPKNAFYQCPRLQALCLPEGFEEIADYAVQTCLSLKSIQLPNTLKHIGGHFLCDAKSLETLTIPASVDKIDGAFLHGCESLRSVYMLGPAATLAATFPDDESGSFSAFDVGNVTAPSSEQVNNCIFYVPSDYYNDYSTNGVWQQLLKANNNVGNDIQTPLPGGERTLGPGKWQTIIFYKPVRSYKSLFGDGCMVADLTSAKVSDENPDMYNLTFTLIAGDDIPAQKPFLIYCAEKKVYQIFDKSDEDTDDFKHFYTTPYITEVKVSNEPQTTVQMIGMGVKQYLQKWDFYFKWDTSKGKGFFYRVPDDRTMASKTTFGCYWKVIRDGLKVDAKGVEQCAMPSATPTSISSQVAPKKVSAAIYDLQGQLVHAEISSLSRGVYIINGKKVWVK